MTLYPENINAKLEAINFDLNRVKSSYNCNWNDVVHDSFARLIDFIKNVQNDIQQHANALKKLCEAVPSIKDSQFFDKEIQEEKAEVEAITI